MQAHPMQQYIHKLNIFSSATSCHNVGNMLLLSLSQADPKQAWGSRHSSAHTAMCLHSGTLYLRGGNITVQGQNMHY